MPELIAVAVDGTPAGQGALILAGRQASRTAAHVAVLCTVDAAYALESRDGALLQEDEIEYPAAAQEALAAGKIVNDAVRDLEALGVHAQGAVLAGEPGREIVAAASRMNASMIVIGHRHLSWFDRILHPSICWEVLEHSDRPVLVSMAGEQLSP